MENFTKTMTDEQLLDVIHSCDAVALPLERRFDGDTDAIDNLLTQLGIKSQDIVMKLMITGEVLREAVSRGLELKRKN